MIILTVRTHGQQPQKTDIYRARRHVCLYAAYITDAIAKWLACWTFDPAVGVPVPLTAGGRVATVGQLLFAPWAWAYSTLHP